MERSRINDVRRSGSKRATRTPGPQSAHMIRYLENLAQCIQFRTTRSIQREDVGLCTAPVEEEEEMEEESLKEDEIPEKRAKLDCHNVLGVK